MNKSRYPILSKKLENKHLIYLDAACTYLRHQDFIDSSWTYYSEYSSCAGDRESSYLGSLLSQDILSVRTNLKKFIWAEMSDYIVFTASTTDSINTLAQAIISNIQTIIVSDLEHNSNYLPWYHIAQKNKKECKLVPFQDVFDPDALKSILQNIEAPFLLSITHASNILGWIFDVAMVAQIVHDFGGYIFVDDAQYLAHNVENVTKNNIDFLAFSAHKLWWPTGIGILYIKNSVSHLITDSIHLGWGTVRKIQDGIPEYKSLPEFLEWWVQNFSSILTLWSIVEARLSQDESALTTYISTLTQYFYEKFEEFWYEKYMTMISLPQGSVITICPKTFHAIDFHQYCNYFLEEHIIAFRTGSFCADNYVNIYLNGEKNIMRFSFGIYNTKNDIDSLFTAIKQYLWL